MSSDEREAEAYYEQQREYYEAEYRREEQESMSDKTKAEQAAEEWADKVGAGGTYHEGQYEFQRERDDITGSFLAGVEWFVENRLKGLLELAQEADYSEDYGQVCFEYSLDELVEKARKA